MSEVFGNSEQLPYTPTTEELLDAYQGRLLKIGDTVYKFIDEEQAEAEFDRWLAEVKAEAVIELVARIEAAVILLGDDDITPTGRRMISKVLNPYRQGEGSGNGASQSPVESSNLLNGEEQ